MVELKPKRPSFASLLVLAVLGAASCAPARADHDVASAPVTTVATTTVQRISLDVVHRAAGTVRGRNTSTLTSKTMGYVREVKVHAGDRVKAGDVLVVLEANDVEANVRRARAALAEATDARLEAESALAAAKAASAVSTTAHDRAVALVASGAIPKQEADEIEARWLATTAQEDMARARVRAASARVDEARAQLAESQATLDYAKITAPFSGRVLERHVDPGALASPGTALLSVEQEGRPRIEAAVDESHARDVSLGDPVIVELESSKAPLQGVVGEIVPSVDPASRAFLVKIDLPTDVEGLRAGMFARVGFRVGTRAAIVVPVASVSTVGELDRVFVVGSGAVHLRMITLGEAQGSLVEVLSGLDPGESIVATLDPALRDGAKVTLAP